jgi:hypothetical protein
MILPISDVWVMRGCPVLQGIVPQGILNQSEASLYIIGLQSSSSE